MGKANQQQSGEQAASPSPAKKAFETLDAMREAVRLDPRPRFSDCQIPVLGGRCRIRRYQPEVLHKLRDELAAAGVVSYEAEVPRELALRLIQRAIVGTEDAALLCPGDDGLARLNLILGDEWAQQLAVAIVLFNEFFG